MNVNVDVAVIGAGLMGSAIARNLSKYELEVALIEKGVDVCNGASKATSAIVHTGFAEKPGTLKAKLIAQGNLEIEKMCKELDVPFQRSGQLILALEYKDREIIDFLRKRSKENGIHNLKMLDREEIQKIEPHIGEEVKFGLFVPDGGVVSPYELCIGLVENALNNGVLLFAGAQVEKIMKHSEDSWIIKTTNNQIKCRILVNAAGINADLISEMAGAESFSIIPVKGEEYILDKNKGDLVRHLLVTASLGVFVIPTTHGNLMVGTTNEPTNKDDYSTRRGVIDDIFKKIMRVIPQLSKKDVITSFAGLRANNNLTEDYIICSSKKVTGLINVSIGSPGVVATPMVAKMVEEMFSQQALSLRLKKNYDPFRQRIPEVRNLSELERSKIIEKDGRYGHVVCRCETVTEGEIVEAIKRGARTLDGVKYRTRAGMGRCQGGFCTPRILRIMERELGIQVTEITKKGHGSFVAPFGKNQFIG